MKSAKNVYAFEKVEDTETTNTFEDWLSYWYQIKDEVIKELHKKSKKQEDDCNDKLDFSINDINILKRALKTYIDVLGNLAL